MTKEVLGGTDGDTAIEMGLGENQGREFGGTADVLLLMSFH